MESYCLIRTSNLAKSKKSDADRAARNLSTLRAFTNYVTLNEEGPGGIFLMRVPKDGQWASGVLG